jgi:hypothetical protein
MSFYVEVTAASHDDALRIVVAEEFLPDSADAEEPNDPRHWRPPSPSAGGSGRGGRPSRPRELA